MVLEVKHLKSRCGIPGTCASLRDCADVIHEGFWDAEIISDHPGRPGVMTEVLKKESKDRVVYRGNRGPWDAWLPHSFVAFCDGGHRKSSPPPPSSPFCSMTSCIAPDCVRTCVPNEVTQTFIAGVWACNGSTHFFFICFGVVVVFH